MSDADSPADIKTARKKQAMRKSIRQLRRAISKTDRRDASNRISQLTLELGVIQSARTIGGFLAFDGEVDPLQLMTGACELKRQVFVPVIIGRGRPLMFAPWQPNVPMRVNQFGINEPDVPSDQWIEPQELDLVLAPLVAFDEDCHRLGVGGGYYDRSFSFLKSTESNRRTEMIGIAFELQKVGRIQTQPWDVVLDAVVTERQIYRNRSV